MEMTPTVYVVDEDPLARRNVRQSATMLNLHCEEYASGPEFIEGLDPSRPGCVVLESRIPGISGLEIQQHLATRAPSLPVVFVTRHATVSTAVRAMRAGAVNVLEKPAREIELWETLQEALHLNQQRRQAAQKRRQAGERIDRLTEKEREVMKAVSAGASNAEMASKFGVSQRTIELRRASMMKKLRVRSLAELVRLVTAAESELLEESLAREPLKTLALAVNWPHWSPELYPPTAEGSFAEAIDGRHNG